MDQNPEEVVDATEQALAASQPCPYCGLWDGTHLVTCEYLKHKGNVDAKRRGRLPKAVKSPAKEEKEPAKEESGEEEKGEDAELLERMKPKE
jgi:hypothetical protein